MINKKNILTIITVLWMALIFCFSNQPSTESSKVSRSFIEKTIIKIYTSVDSDATKEEKDTIIKYAHSPIRKLAHLSVYFVLGILVLFTLKEYNIEKNIIYYSIIICAIYAISDEIHQFFVPGRSCEFRDVMIDTIGSTFGILVFKRK